MKAILDDPSWKIRLANGDIDAFSEIYQAYSKALYKVIYNKVGSKEVAEDILHDVFINLWNKKNSILIESSFFYYLYGMTKNTVLMYFRSDKAKAILLNNIALWQSNSDLTTENQINYNDLDTYLGAKVEELPMKCKEIFRMSRYEHLTILEIADKLSISPQTVKNQLSKALMFLRHHLKDAALLFLLWKD